MNHWFVQGWRNLNWLLLMHWAFTNSALDCPGMAEGRIQVMELLRSGDCRRMTLTQVRYSYDILHSFVEWMGKDDSGESHFSHTKFTFSGNRDLLGEQYTPSHDNWLWEIYNCLLMQDEFVNSLSDYKLPFRWKLWSSIFKMESTLFQGPANAS